MVDPKAGKFINSLVKSLQMLCHGYMDFKDNIEIIGHIYLRIDNSQKFDYIVNEQVSRQGDDSTFFQSNSYHSQPPAKAVREKDRPASENIDDDAVTNHIRLDDAAVSGSRVQIDLSGPVPVTRHSELSPGRRFSTSSNASDADHHTSYGRDSHRHSFDEEAAKTLSPEDHPHNHSSLSSARDRDVCERPASSSSERTEINTIFQVKVAEKSRQHESDGLHEFDGTVIVKAEPDEGNHDCVMEEEGTQNQGREMQRIPSVASVLPPAHQSALVANSAHAGHAMFAATLGHSGMFDTSMPTQDSNLIAGTEGHGGRESGSEQALDTSSSLHSHNLIHMGDMSPSSVAVRRSGLVSQMQRTRKHGSDRTPLRHAHGKNSDDSADQMRVPVVHPDSPAAKKHKGDSIMCVVCGTQFRNLKLMHMHMRLVHRMHSLPLDQGQSSECVFEENVNTPGSSNQPVENVCPEKLDKSNSQKLKANISASLSVHAASDQCSGLGTSQTQFQINKSESQPMSCQFCQLLFWDKMKFFDHLSLCSQRNTQLKEHDTYVCALCSQSFSDSGKLAEHQLQCSNQQSTGSVSPSPASCPNCQLLLWDQSQLAAHMWTCGKGNNWCEDCGKTFQSRTSLVDHINSMHKGMQFSCSDCGETFKWRTCVYRHKTRCRGAKQTPQKEEMTDNDHQ